MNSPGCPVKAGEPIAVLGRSANTAPAISKERAHLHFELSLRLSDRFRAWHAARAPNQRNDHGEWNGRNFLGFDPAAVLRQQAAKGSSFSLLRHLKEQRELCRIAVRVRSFSWLDRYRLLVEPDPQTPPAQIAGYELSLNSVGLPFRIVPRTAAGLKGAARFRVVAVNAEERAAHPCRRLVRSRTGGWELDRDGEQLLDLLTFQ